VCVWEAARHCGSGGNSYVILAGERRRYSVDSRIAMRRTAAQTCALARSCGAGGRPAVVLRRHGRLVEGSSWRSTAALSSTWGVDGPPGATGVLSGRGGRKRGSPLRSVNEVIHLIQGCHCALLQKLCKLPKSQTLNPYSGAEF